MSSKDQIVSSCAQLLHAENQVKDKSVQDEIGSSIAQLLKSELWDDAKSAVEDGSITLADAYITMASTTSGILSKYSVNLSSALSNLLPALGGVEASDGSPSSGGHSLVPSEGGGLTVDYSKIMLTTDDPAVYAAAETARDAKMVSGKYSNVRPNSEIAAASKLYGKGTYDSGGIASGKGILAKATDRPESVLDPDLTAKLLSLTSDEVFRQNMERIGAMFSTPSMVSSMERPISNSSSADSHNITYQINGVSVPTDAENMTIKQFAQAFGTLSVFPS